MGLIVAAPEETPVVLGRITTVKDKSILQSSALDVTNEITK